MVFYQNYKRTNFVSNRSCIFWGSMRMRENKEKVKWSELCPDLLRCIFERLSFRDMNRVRSVCWSWHSVSRGCVPKPNQIPWLILLPAVKNKIEGNSCLLFIPDDRENVYRTRDLGLVRSCCLASYGSWLLIMDSLWNLKIMNPLTGERIDDLPLTESFVPRRCSSMLKLSLACLWVDEKSRDYLVVWRMSMFPFLVFTKKGNNTWRQISSMDLGPPLYDEHMVYNHKAQNLYLHRRFRGRPDGIGLVRYRDNNVRIWHLCEDDDDPQGGVFEAKPCICVTFCYSVFLTAEMGREAKDLYLQEFLDGWLNIAITVSGQVIKIVSVLQRSKRWLVSISKHLGEEDEWEIMDSLGDEALILDMGVTVVAKDIPGIKRNSIYFSGFGYRRKNPDHIFVFDLTTHEIEPLPSSLFSSFPFSDARWFFPDLSSFCFL